MQKYSGPFMLSVTQALKKRSSKRAYQNKSVPKEIQEKILEAAAQTPSGANMQPWITYTVSYEKVLKDIGDAIIAKPVAQLAQGWRAGADHPQGRRY
jgi:nitroreductase